MKGHIEVPGNEAADEQAKKGTTASHTNGSKQCTPPSAKTSLTSDNLNCLEKALYDSKATKYKATTTEVKGGFLILSEVARPKPIQNHRTSRTPTAGRHSAGPRRPCVYVLNPYYTLAASMLSFAPAAVSPMSGLSVVSRRSCWKVFLKIM